jgi:GABA permease
MPHYLVVGNETLDSEVLLRRLQELAAAGATFSLLVPASHPRGSWTESMVEAAARTRLEEITARWRELGLTVTGEIGEASPYRAIGDVLRSHDEPFDAIILSTHPAGISRWLHADLVHRVERDYPLPVIHVVATPEPAL